MTNIANTIDHGFEVITDILIPFLTWISKIEIILSVNFILSLENLFNFRPSITRIG